jgi:CubicO group peptidase (beta-lactamase class C family)
MSRVRTDRVDELFADWNKPDSPGCAIAIIQEGEIIYKQGYGMADLEHEIPISPKSIFEIGSTSKQFTAICIALLVCQDKLSLEDEVQKYITELTTYEHPITVRHLIHHTSGIRDYLSLMDLVGLRFENEYPFEEVIGLISRQKQLNFIPGEEYLYSNSGYLLLGEVVKRVSGQSLRKYADEHIFIPLGMKNSHFHDDFTEIVKARAMGYSSKENSGFRIDVSIFDVVGDGCLYTNVEDLCLWDQNFYHNLLGGFGQELIEMVTTPGLLNNGQLLDYAFGLEIGKYKGLKMIHHAGSWMGYSAELIRIPERSFSVVCLSNLSSVNPSRLAKQVADLYLSDVVPTFEIKTTQREVEAIKLSRQELESKVGIYFCPETGSVCELSLKEGKLRSDVFGVNFPITHTDKYQFKAMEIPYDIDFKFEEANLDQEPVMQIQVEEQTTHTYTKMKPVYLNSDQLKEFAGEYYCEELNTSYRIILRDGMLHYSKKSTHEGTLKQVADDLFFWSEITFRFWRDSKNQVSGFSLGAGRVKNLKFVKQNAEQIRGN